MGRGDPPRSAGWPPVTYWMKVTAGVLVILALARMVVAVQNVLILIVISLVLAIGFQPAVRSLERRGLRRGLAVALIFLGGALSFIYMFQIYQHAYWRGERHGEEAAGTRLVAPALGVAALVVALGVWPEPLLAVSQEAADALGRGPP